MKIFLIILTTIATLIAKGQPGIEWQNTIGGNSDDWFSSVKQTTDGGYILGGTSYSNISVDKTENPIGGYDYWIVKTDSIGNVQWDNTIGDTNYDYLHAIEQTADGGYILAGNSNSNISGDKTENCIGFDDYWIVKTDASGNIQWQNTIGGSKYDFLNCIRQTNDGGYILGGKSDSNISGDKTENCFSIYADYWVVKTDSVGNIQWQNTIGGNDEDQLLCIQQTNDAGYILGGISLSNISGDKTEDNMDTICNPYCTYDYWIVKTDSSGNIQWQNTIGGNDHDYLSSIQQTTDAGYILGGWSESNISGDKTENNIGNGDYWVVKTDSLGNIQWQNTIGGNDDDRLCSIQQTIDGGYILGGWSESNNSGDKTENNIGNGDYWVVKTDSLGNIQWQNTIGGSGLDGLISIQQTSDEGYILGGWSYSNISGDKTENSMGDRDYWIVKLAPDTITGISQLSQLPNYPITISPNPFTNKLNVTVNNNEFNEIILYDIASRKLLQQKFTNSISLNTEQLAKGLYLYEVRDKNGLCKKGKVVKD